MSCEMKLGKWFEDMQNEKYELQQENARLKEQVRIFREALEDIAELPPDAGYCEHHAQKALQAADQVGKEKGGGV